MNEYAALLKKKGNAVPWNLPTIAQPVGDFRAFSAKLETTDVDRMFMWFEFRKHTKDGSSKLTDSLPEAAEVPRIKSFIQGDSQKPPADLRTTPNLEPMLVTHDLHRGPLYGIDGNHRMVAQFLSGKSFDGVPVYVCTHPNLLTWAYIPKSAKEWFAARGLT